MPEATQPALSQRQGERARLVALPGGQSGFWARTPVPSQVSSFVGREAELSEVVRLLQDHRLVTLTGVGGSGKTRLALAVVGELDQMFTDGVRVVELAAIADPELVPQVVAAAAGIGERPRQTFTKTLTDVLQSRSALLVLDNCEHLVDACAALAAAVLRSCPQMRVLATSREALGITGEVAWPVPPLQEAVQLFTDRAAAARPSFALTEQNAPVVARIVDQLDGLPLALELAATRVRVLSVPEIASRLGEALRLLVGDRTATGRHSTLTATFDWSHALLSPTEQVLFRRLSVFRGGFTLAAAEAVCAEPAPASGEVLERLAVLVEKSLVVADPASEQTRYRLLEVVRQYAEERLVAAGEEVEVSAGHAAYFARLGAAAEAGSVGFGEPLWLARIAVEHDNLRAALTWLSGPGGPGPEMAELASTLWPFWFVRGLSTEGMGWLQAGIDRAGAGNRPDRAKARAWNGLGVLAAFQEDYSLAFTAGQEALAGYRALNDVDGIATSLLALATTTVTGQLSDVDVAELLAEARHLQPQVRDRRVLGHLRHIEGAVALLAGDPATAVKQWQEALAVHREVGDLIGEAFTTANLGLLFARLGNADKAGPSLTDALQLSRRLDYKLIIQYCLIGLGKLAADANHLHRAARLWGAADALEEAYGAHLTRAGRAMLDYDTQLACTRPQLAEPVWRAEWTQGRRMTTDQAIDYALADGAVPDVRPTDAHPGGLTDREVDVLRLVARGLTSADVGRQLFLSARTVDWHLSSIYSKLGVRSRTEATRFAVDHGLG